ncbi:42072_t:CDS:2 [Gigaspora margarita]|uniref:42072_t:CDS:1 n=1 Tax=Gigaspora margarita TaxID=4874 RepID=A0ABN7V0G1_GIGMA|nr:42072_t:CDS:2 [Gigaspora margarita]
METIRRGNSKKKKSRPASTLRNSDQQKHTRGLMKNASNKRNNKYRCKEEIKTSRP